MTTLRGALVAIRPATDLDVPALAAIRATPEVRRRWAGGDDLGAEISADIAGDDEEVYAVEHDGRLVGAIHTHEETEPMYRHAGIDIYLDPAVHGRGLRTDAVRTFARHLIHDRGHHRITIDPAADNAPAIRAYEKVGFRPVGIMRRYERGGVAIGRAENLGVLLVGETRAVPPPAAHLQPGPVPAEPHPRPVDTPG